MKGDIALAGFVLTAEEWQALDPATREMLRELNRQDAESAKPEPGDRSAPNLATSAPWR